MRSTIAIAAAAALAALGASAGTAVAQTEIKVPLETPAPHIKTRTAEVFKAALEKASGGKYKVTLYPAAQLMPGKDEVPAVARGQVQMAMPTIGYVSTIEPTFKVLEAPMLFDSYDAMEKVLNGSVGSELLGKLSAKRLKGLGFWYDGFVTLWSANPIRTLADLKDKKIRVFPSEVLANSTTALGAAPTAIPGAEVFLALKQGVADGAWTSTTYGNQIKLYEVLKAVTKVNLFPFGYVVVTNPAWWDKQGAAGREMIEAALAEGKAFNLREITKSIDDAYKNLAANGMAVVDIAPQERARWIEALKPVYEGLDADVKAFVERARKM